MLQRKVVTVWKLTFPVVFFYTFYVEYTISY